MVTETTMCVRGETREKLEAASLAAGVSRSRLVSSLLNYASKRMHVDRSSRGGIRYQERLEGIERGRMHLRLRNDEYEFFIDMRKVWKMSVSFLVAYAVELFLDELLQKMTMNPDNYRYRNYAMTKVYAGDVICWIFYWGIPRKLIKTPAP